MIIVLIKIFHIETLNNIGNINVNIMKKIKINFKNGKNNIVKIIELKLKNKNNNIMKTIKK